MKNLNLIFITILISFRIYSQDSISVTYTAGDIPTSYNEYDASCNGPSTILSVSLPGGDNYQVTKISVVYSMTALGNAWKSEQRSQVHCQNSNTTESSVFSGVGDAPGIYNYSRDDVSIANGTYPGYTDLVFEMRAWRTWEGTAGCRTAENKVDVSSWTITIYFGEEIINPKVGIRTLSPLSTLDIEGEIKLGSSSNFPIAGMIRWNNISQDFEGYNGTQLLSLTNQGKLGGGWGDQFVVENTFQIHQAMVQQTIILVGL